MITRATRPNRLKVAFETPNRSGTTFHRRARPPRAGHDPGQPRCCRGRTSSQRSSKPPWLCTGRGASGALPTAEPPEGILAGGIRRPGGSRWNTQGPSLTSGNADICFRPPRSAGCVTPNWLCRSSGRCPSSATGPAWWCCCDDRLCGQGVFRQTTVVAFKAGEWLRSERLGWSVHFVGKAQAVPEQDCLRVTELGLQTWLDGQPALYVTVETDVLTGIRVEPAPAAGRRAQCAHGGADATT